MKTIETVKTVKTVLLTLLKLVELMGTFFRTTKEEVKGNQTRSFTEGEEDHNERDPDGD